MKRFYIFLAATLLGLLGLAGPAAAQHVPELGCHRVYVTPPGAAQPVAVTICP